jgi:hypothetical protein
MKLRDYQETAADFLYQHDRAMILAPVGAALLVLLGLVVVKHLFFALGRSLRDLSRTDRPTRRQRRKAATSGLDQIG